MPFRASSSSAHLCAEIQHELNKCLLAVINCAVMWTTMWLIARGRKRSKTKTRLLHRKVCAWDQGEHLVLQNWSSMMKQHDELMITWMRWCCWRKEFSFSLNWIVLMQKFKENVRVVKMPMRIVFGESHIERVYWEAWLAKIKYRMVLHEEKSVDRYWNLVLSSNDETKNNKRSVVLPPAVSLGNCPSLVSCLQSKLNQSCEGIPRNHLRREWYSVVVFFFFFFTQL